MEELDKQYTEHLQAIKDAIQGSEILAAYLEEEEEEYYKQLQEYFEPAMQQVFDQIAMENPLQLEQLEKAYQDPAFEGLFLPKILGYSVLRGEIDENYKYRRPQNHFKEILLAICESANFEMLKKRIGQTVQLGFALSSDIWITNIIERQSNKRVKAFLQSLKLDKFREVHNRKSLYEKYSAQLDDVNFASTQFPQNEIELKASFHSLKSFIVYRAKENLDNSELMPEITNFIKNKAFVKNDLFFELLIIIGMSYPLDKETEKSFQEAFSAIMKNNSNFEEKFFQYYENLHESEDIHITPEHQARLSKLIKNLGSNEVDNYFAVIDEVHSKGFIHVEAIEAVRTYYERHKGMSLQNECLRASILNYIKNVISNLEAENYPDYMEIMKVVIAYIGIFDNEKFNQVIKELGLTFVNKCISKYTDKKSRDYQDVKKYTVATFTNLGFMNTKELTELFKTKRKPNAKK